MAKYNGLNQTLEMMELDQYIGDNREQRRKQAKRRRAINAFQFMGIEAMIEAETTFKYENQENYYIWLNYSKIINVTKSIRIQLSLLENVFVEIKESIHGGYLHAGAAQSLLLNKEQFTLFLRFLENIKMSKDKYFYDFKIKDDCAGL